LFITSTVTHRREKNQEQNTDTKITIFLRSVDKKVALFIGDRWDNNLSEISINSKDDANV
jgi:hypothetical protein